MLLTAWLLPALAQDLDGTWVVHPVDPKPQAWQRLVGRRLHLAPEHARDLTLTLCEEHFPEGSQAWRNALTAITAVSQAPDVDIEITVASGRHLDPNALYAGPEGERYRVELTDVRPLKNRSPPPAGRPVPTGELGATGAAFHLGIDPATREPIWTWGRTTDGFPSDRVVLALRLSDFDRPHHRAQGIARCDTAGPGGLDWSREVRCAPSVGVIAHELSHSLGMGHPDELALAWQDRASGAIWSGESGWWHGSDVRIGRLFALEQARLEWRYPVTAPTDTTHEWTVHPVMPLRGGPRQVVTPDRVKTLAGANPTNLMWSEAEGAYLDCATGELPVLVAQLSDTGHGPCTASDRVAVAWSLRTHADPSWRSVHTARLPQACEADLVQYTWLLPARIGRQSGDKAQLRFAVDPDQQWAERDESDNQATLVLALHPADACPGT